MRPAHSANSNMLPKAIDEILMLQGKVPSNLRENNPLLVLEGTGNPILKPDSKAGAQVLNLDNVDEAAKQYAFNLKENILNGVIRKTTGGKIDSKVLTIAVDKKTGEMFYGTSGMKNNPTRLDDTHTKLQKTLNNKVNSETNYPLENCGEFNAINDALTDGNKITDLKLFAIDIKSGSLKKRCLNCDAMYRSLVPIIRD